MGANPIRCKSIAQAVEREPKPGHLFCMCSVYCVPPAPTAGRTGFLLPPHSTEDRTATELRASAPCRLRRASLPERRISSTLAGAPQLRPLSQQGLNMSLAAKIRDYDPRQKSADVAHELGCSAEYVRAVWQRMCPKKRRRELVTAVHRYHKNHEYRAAKLAWNRAYYHANKNT